MVQTPIQTVRSDDRRLYGRWDIRPYRRIQTPLQTVDTHTPYNPQPSVSPVLGFGSPRATDGLSKRVSFLGSSSATHGVQGLCRLLARCRCRQRCRTERLLGLASACRVQLWVQHHSCDGHVIAAQGLQVLRSLVCQFGAGPLRPGATRDRQRWLRGWPSRPGVPPPPPPTLATVRHLDLLILNRGQLLEFSAAGSWNFRVGLWPSKVGSSSSALLKGNTAGIVSSERNCTVKHSPWRQKDDRSRGGS
jgi:hypothetical protein